ncbi:MAG TPA: hypothetical protein VEV81_15260, partial [Pyrinomonadaceae bacterium]|nr:hypothetical protein [Pyrinomonadaceae bacterium]
FTDYTRQANRDLIERSFNGTDFLKDIPAEARDAVAAYPEDFTCRLRSQKAATAPPRVGEELSSAAGRIRPTASLFLSGAPGLVDGKCFLTSAWR